jgi:hypothetical protein
MVTVITGLLAPAQAGVQGGRRLGERLEERKREGEGEGKRKRGGGGEGEAREGERLSVTEAMERLSAGISPSRLVPTQTAAGTRAGTTMTLREPGERRRDSEKLRARENERETQTEPVRPGD